MDQFADAVRDLMVRHGLPMEPGEVDAFGWTDYEALEHTRKYGDGCSWVIPSGAKVSEQTYSMFEDTLVGNRNEVGLEVAGCRCACRRYQNVTLRYVGSMGDVLRGLRL